jgi:hypothetical protein
MTEQLPFPAVLDDMRSALIRMGAFPNRPMAGPALIHIAAHDGDGINVYKARDTVGASAEILHKALDVVVSEARIADMEGHHA